MPRYPLLGALLTALVLSLATTTQALAEEPDWTPAGRSTYTGTWTVSHYETDAESDDPEYGLGDSAAGTLVIDCTMSETSCGLEAAFDDGESLFVGSAAVVGEGRLAHTETEVLDNCGGGQVSERTVEVEFGPTEATAVEARSYDPRTCTDATSTLYMTDSTWSFTGSLTGYDPPQAPTAPEAPGDVRSFLDGYGFDCAGDGVEVECLLELSDEEGLDATYSVVIRRGSDGAIVALDAGVVSLDDSMPSDAGGFLRSVVGFVPAEDPALLVEWFDMAVAGSSSAETVIGSWAATWNETSDDAGTTWAMSLADLEAAPSASATALAVPAPAPTATDAALPAPAPPDDPVAQPFADSVPRADEVSTDPLVIVQSALLAAIVVFLMPFPGQLFNSTLEAHEDEVRGWFRLDRLGVVARGVGAFWASWPGAMAFTVLATLLYSFLDPGFGLDLASLATFVGMLLGIVMVTAAFALPAILAHRRIGEWPTFKVVPISLLIGIVCVLVSRLTEFQPGYLYGLLLGLVFAGELSAADEGRTTAIGAALMLSVALASWLALGILGDGDGFGLVALRTSLAALMVAGLEGVLFGLLPMRFLPGEPLYAWNRALWALLLGAGAFAFFHILINPASGYLSDTSRTPLLTVIGLLLGFSVLSVAFWAWFRFRPPSEPAVSRAP